MRTRGKPATRASPPSRLTESGRLLRARLCRSRPPRAARGGRRAASPRPSSPPPNQVGLERVRREHPVRDPEQLEQAGRDLAGQDVLRRVLATMTAPGHEQQRGKPYMSASEASALRLVPRPEFCISTAGRRPANQAPAAQSDRHVFARRRDIRQARVASSVAIRSSISEQGTPAKKSNPRRSRSAAISAPDTVIAVESDAVSLPGLILGHEIDRRRARRLAQEDGSRGASFCGAVNRREGSMKTTPPGY